MKHSRTKYTVNQDFFSIANIGNCYWAGFIAADGCIRYRTENSKNLQIHLQYKDRQHIEEFKKVIEFTGNILDEQNNSRVVASKIEICSVQLCNDLFKHWNIGPKSP